MLERGPVILADKITSAREVFNTTASPANSAMFFALFISFSLLFDDFFVTYKEKVISNLKAV